MTMTVQEAIRQGFTTVNDIKGMLEMHGYNDGDQEPGDRLLAWQIMQMISQMTHLVVSQNFEIEILRAQLEATRQVIQ